MDTEATGNYVIAWERYTENIKSAFSSLRNDSLFFDVTLVTEDHKIFEAHKVILAASSDFFRDILKVSTNPSLLIYLKGISNNHMESILSYVYQGEVTIEKENIDDFLSVAEELKIKGFSSDIDLAKNEMSSFDADDPATNEHYNNLNTGDKSNNCFVSKLSIRREYSNPLVLKETNGQDVKEMKSSMINKSETGLWVCSQCGKTSKRKQDLERHVETHIDGVSYMCKECKRSYRYKTN